MKTRHGPCSSHKKARLRLLGPPDHDLYEPYVEWCEGELFAGKPTGCCFCGGMHFSNACSAELVNEEASACRAEFHRQDAADEAWLS